MPSSVDLLSGVFDIPDIRDTGEEKSQVMQAVVNKWESMQDKVGKCKEISSVEIIVTFSFFFCLLSTTVHNAYGIIYSAQRFLCNC